MKKYIVYITYYTGNKLPPFYIGSSYEDKIIKGYNGSVLSEKYKEIYKEEQKENKKLFRTRILSYHETREESLKEELRLQKKHNVVKNKRYFNESYAQPNGYFGRDVSGKLHPLYNIGHSEKSRELISKNHADVSGKNNPMYGKRHTLEARNKVGKANKGKLLGKKNPMTKVIQIINEKDDIIYKSDGNFKLFCEENKLPYSSFRTSYLNNIRLGATKHSKTLLIKNDFGKYIGWKAEIKGN